MRVAILDDIHHAYEGTSGVGRLRERADVRIFTGRFGNPEALAGFDAVVANRERTMFTRDIHFGCRAESTFALPAREPIAPPACGQIMRTSGNRAAVP